MLGKVEVQNDFGAKLLAPKLVRKLETVECDPRLPDDIVTKDCSSAVRSRSNVRNYFSDGWLRIGLSIPVADAKKHGCHVLMDKGVVLDLLKARIYKMETTESGEERILSASSTFKCKQHSVHRNASIV